MPTEKAVDMVWAQAGLTDAEYRRVVGFLGREPNHLELHLYGAMWSEHCSYKNSKPVLKKFPTRGPRVLQGPGENAGVIDLGDGLAVAFKVESHNHPSAIEPFQGAATGVGGILRDVFTMGARPIALLDSLRFGDPADSRVRHLVSGVVGGIGFYGNCMGVPTVAGEVYFEECYRGNPLVNAMCVGLVSGGKVFKGVAQGVGNPIMAVGARTGRDGIGGAAFASEELSEASEARRPSVQVGDPFKEKLLLEACLELFETDAVVGIQDMGAAGLVSSASEMASRGDTGIEIDIDRVPRRETGMQPWEVMLSESQERMLVCVQAGREAEVQRIFDKWELEATVIGHVTDDGVLRIRENGRTVGEVPARTLAEDAPVYVREQREPGYLTEARAFDFGSLPVPESLQDVLLQLIGSANLASREWVYRQYDHQVLINTVSLPGQSDAAVLRLPGTARGLALKIDCNPRYCYLNPYRGGAIAVAEAARNIVCSGGEPLAITNCLNFGNPMKPEVFWTFDQAVMGMAAACTALGTPVTGGNVSFYNESGPDAVYPTPVVGMVGVVEDLARHRTTMGFKQAGDVIVVLGETKPELGGSEYAKVIHGVVAGDVPELDLEREQQVQALARRAIREGLVTAAHDVAEGGLAVALTEMALAAAPGARGFQITLETRERPDAVLFGESQSRIILTVKRDDMMLLKGMLIENGVPHRVIGDVQDGTVQVAGLEPGVTDPFIFRRVLYVNLEIEVLEKNWREGLPCILDA